MPVHGSCTIALFHVLRVRIDKPLSNGRADDFRCPRIMSTCDTCYVK